MTRFWRAGIVCCQLVFIGGGPCWAETGHACLDRMLPMVAGVFQASGESLDKEGQLQKFEQRYRAELTGSDVTFYTEDIKVGTWHFSDPDFSFVIYNDKNKQAPRPTKFTFECRATTSANELEAVAEWESDPNEAGGSQWLFRQRQIVSPKRIIAVLQVKSAGSDLPFVIASQSVSTRSD